MMFNVGNGLLTANIDLQRLHQIKESTLPPEMSLWEKIKQFFCSTQQGQALKCIHKLYHHETLKLSEEDIRETFIELRSLASPGCRNKFTIERCNTDNIYKINNEVIISIPRSQSNDVVNHDDDIWFDCEEQNEVWHDCIDGVAPEPFSESFRGSDFDSSSIDSRDLEQYSDSEVSINSDDSGYAAIKA